MAPMPTSSRANERWLVVPEMVVAKPRPHLVHPSPPIIREATIVVARGVRTTIIAQSIARINMVAVGTATVAAEAAATTVVAMRASGTTIMAQTVVVSMTKVVEATTMIEEANTTIKSLPHTTTIAMATMEAMCIMWVTARGVVPVLALSLARLGGVGAGAAASAACLAARGVQAEAAAGAGVVGAALEAIAMACLWQSIQ